MATDSLKFENFDHGYFDSRLDAELMVRMFGEDVCVAQSSPCTLKPAARTWMSNANSAMSGGRCEGFAVVSSLFFSKDLKPDDFGAPTARELELAGNAGLQRELAYWFATQMVPEVVASQTRSFAAKDVMPFLADTLKPDATERYRLGIINKQGKKVLGAHAMTPISYHRGERAGLYYLRVYDNNNPDSERELKIDTAANRWEYQAARNPNKRSSLFYGDDSNHNLLYFAPVRNRLGTLKCQFCKSTDAVVATTSGGVEALVSSAIGKVGVKDGELIAEGGGAVSPSFTSDLEEGPAEYNLYAPASNAVSVAIGGDPTQTAGAFAAFGPGYSVALSGMTLSGEKTNTLAIGEGGNEVTFQNDDHSPVTVASTLTSKSGGTVEVTVSVGEGSTQVGLNVNADTGSIDVATQGDSDGTVTVTVAQTSPDGETRSGQLDFSPSDGGTTQLDVDLGTWADGGTLTGTVDDGSGPRPVTDLCLDGAKSGQETDVDCGGPACSTACALSQHCTSGRDCASTFCDADTQRCVADACVDHVRDGSETDVDCGGSSCGRCALGKSCTMGSDCLSDACMGGACVATFAIGAQVSGLPPGASLTLLDNGTDPLVVGSDGSYQFPRRVVGTYAVTVSQQPGNATCLVTNGTGTASATSVATVTCTPLFQIAGTLAGLPSGQSLTLLNNGGDAVTLTADGTFFFPTLVPGAYAVTVQAQPSGATCTVASGTGTASGNVSNVAVTCASGSTIGGTLSGLPAGQTVVLTNNGGDALSLGANGSFTFATRVAGAYAVAVATQPTTATCVVANGAGVATADVTSVAVTCTPTWSIGGSVSGLPASTSVVLRNNGGNDTTVSANTTFTFSTRVAGAYSVTVATQPSGGFCSVAQGAGTASANVANVAVTCTALGPLDPTFGGGTGFVRSPASGTDHLWRSVALNPDDSQVWAGTDTVGDDRWVVTRLTVNGSLDTTFGTNGSLFINRGAAQGEGARVIRRLPDGSYLVAGRLAASNFDAAIAKVTSAGALDGAFGTAGVVTFDLGGDETVEDLVVMADGRMVLGGTTVGVSDNQQFVLRLTPAGAFDTTFAGGTVLLGSGTVLEAATSLAVDATGIVYVAGSSGNNSSITKLTNLGAFDTSFNGTGTRVIDISGVGNPNNIRALVLEQAGTLLALGQTDNGTGLDGFLARLTTTGALATSWGGTGLVTFNRGTTHTPTALRQRSNGQLWVGGLVDGKGFVGRFDPGGTVDTTFATNGFFVSAFGGYAAFYDLALDSTGRVVAGGLIGPLASPDFGACRLNP